MVQVVDYEEFKRLVEKVEKLESEVTFWKDLLTQQRQLSRIQTMTALRYSSATLNRITKLGKILYQKTGRKIRYGVDSVRSYLTVKKIDQIYVDQRIATAMHSGNN